MGKHISHTPVLRKKFYPFVSICTPTFNRRPFIPTLLQCFLNQDYPHDRMEWIIVDDGTDSIQDLIDASKISQIRYFRQEKKMPLGEKRNFMHSKAKGTIIVYMDDDDYYPPERVSHAVDTLTNNKDALCVGASEIYIYFKHIQKMYQSGPYGPNHATAGTFAFRTELLKMTAYENHAALAEEKHFLKNYTIPFAQLDPLKTILVFSHEHNTFDKRRLLENQHHEYFKESNKTVDQFIRNDIEEPIKQFFMKDIDNLLKKYKPGEPNMKPDVLEQMKKLDENYKKMTEEGGGQGVQLMINENGKEPRALLPNEIIQIINNQMEQIQLLTQKNEGLEKMVANLYKKKSEDIKKSEDTKFTDILLKRINELERENTILKNENKKSENKNNNVSDSQPSQIITPLQMKSKTIPEIVVDIHH
jgi:glycosyltransferase involved in cell wall biosynthesis